VPNPSTTVSIGNSSVAGSSHLLVLVQPGNPAVYDLVFMHLTPNQQPSDADTGREEAICLQALASSGCPSPPACLSLRISSRPPVILQPAAPALSSCEEQTASLIFNISNNDPLETISFKFDELPLPLAAYGITVGDALVFSDSSGVQYMSFQVNLTTFSQGLQSKTLMRDFLPHIPCSCCCHACFRSFAAAFFADGPVAVESSGRRSPRPDQRICVTVSDNARSVFRSGQNK
jgi:hypothetical protein